MPVTRDAIGLVEDILAACELIGTTLRGWTRLVFIFTTITIFLVIYGGKKQNKTGIVKMRQCHSQKKFNSPHSHRLGMHLPFSHLKLSGVQFTGEIMSVW